MVRASLAGSVRTEPPAREFHVAEGPRAGGRQHFWDGRASTGRWPNGLCSMNLGDVGARQVGDAWTYVVSVCGGGSRMPDGPSGKSAFGQYESPGVPGGLREQASVAARKPR